MTFEMTERANERTDLRVRQMEIKNKIEHQVMAVNVINA